MNDIDKKKNEYAARLEGEEEARHVMGVVPVILAANVVMVLTVICLAAVLILFCRGGE